MSQANFAVSEDATTSALTATAEAVPSASGATSLSTDVSSSEGFEVIEAAEAMRKEAISTKDKKER